MSSVRRPRAFCRSVTGAITVVEGIGDNGCEYRRRHICFLCDEENRRQLWQDDRRLCRRDGMKMATSANATRKLVEVDVSWPSMKSTCAV